MHARALQTSEEIKRYIDFINEVYRDNPVWIPPDGERMFHLMRGEGAQAASSRVQPFWVEDKGRIVGVVTAYIQDSFNRYWDEAVGNLIYFEALPDHSEAIRTLIDTGLRWLREQGCTAARMCWFLSKQSPLTIDAYSVVPSFIHSCNPSYYHAYIKDMGFATEKGLVQYKIQFTPELAREYERMVERTTSTGVTLRSWDFARLEEEIEVFTDVHNDSFAEHWAAHMFTLAEAREFLLPAAPILVPQFTVLAEVEGKPVGFVFALPDLNQAFHKMRHEGAELAESMGAIDHGVLLVIGVRKPYRSRGINLGMAARSYLAMIERGYKSADYTYVVDDNWPSRRTAEKLGGHVTRNFVVYRRELA